MKKITFLMVALICALPMFAQTTLYLNTGGASLWNQGNAKFAAYDVNTSTFSDFMTLVPGETDIYKTTFQSPVTKIIFVRLDPTATTPNWDNRWNQTNDLDVIDTNNCFTVTAWNDGTDGNPSIGTWSTYTEASYSLSIEAPEAGFVNEQLTITATPNGFTNPTIVYELGRDDMSSYETVTMPYTPTQAGTYTFHVTATEGTNSANKIATVEIYDIPTNVITVKAQKPAEWTNDMYIHFWYDHGSSSTPVAMTKVANTDDWYTYEFTRYYGTEVNVIFINGSEWGNGQTEDIKNITTNSCYTIANATETDAKCIATATDCAGTPTDVETTQTSQFDIIGTNNHIYINGEGDAQLRIFNVTGQMIVNTSFNSNFECELQKGIYIVYLNGKTQKVSVN